MGVDSILMVFKVASDARSHPPVDGSERVRSGINIDDRNQHGSLQCAQPNKVQIILGTWRVHENGYRFLRFACITMGDSRSSISGEVVHSNNRIGVSNYRLSPLGSHSTLVWMMLLMSSILAHSSAANPRVSARVALGFSYALRWTGKSLAISNFLLVIMACVFQYSNFYDRCYCNSSVLSRRGAAYAVIIETTAQAAQDKAAWIGAFVLACTSASFFLGILNLLSDTLPS